MSEEKRKAPRHAIWFPMKMDTRGDVIMGISRDLSEVGVLMVAAAEPKPGAKVTMTMSIPGDEVAERTVSGTIMRVQDNDADSEGLWQHKVAVAFDERLDELDQLLEEVARQSTPPAEP